MNALRAYASILRQQMAAGLQFRAAFWARIATNMFWGFVRAVLFWVYFRYGVGESGGMNAVQAVSYIWLGQIFMNLLPGMGMDGEVWNKIRTGDIGVELCRPLDVYGHWFARSIAVKLAPFLMAILPITTVALLLPEGLRLSTPASAAGLLACIITMLCGLFLSSACIGLTYAMLMDGRWGDAPVRLTYVLMQILAGQYVPLELWPDWLQKLLYFQPFAGIMDLPLRFYVGTLPPSAIVQVLPIQLLWGVVILVMGRIWVQRSLHRIVIQGG